MFPSRLVHHEVTTEAEVLLYHCVPKYNELLYINRVFAEKEFGWVRFLVVCSYIKPIPTHEKLFVVGKSGPNTTAVKLLFLGVGLALLGWGVRRFHNNIRIVSNPTLFGKKSQKS